VLAFGDSITNGGGELQWGVALQSWAQWVARGLGLPFTSYATDGARVEQVLGLQIPVWQATNANPDARYDLGCLYIGVNDVRALDWDLAAFAHGYQRALRAVGERCDHLVTMTIPLDLGRPRAGARVQQCNEVIEQVASEAGAVVVDLRGLRARNLVMADRVHPTAFGQIATAERALTVLHERAGLTPVLAPHELIFYETTRRGRLRGDATYAYRSLKEHCRAVGFRVRVRTLKLLAAARSPR
jgi:lysophospholipase L1-like esterase